MYSAEGKEDDYLMESSSAKTRNLHVASAIFGSFVACTVGLTAPFVLTKSSLPYMATPGPKIRRALQYLRKGSQSNNDVFVDLGSGDGEAVYQAARLGYRTIGIELNFTLWAFSSIRRKLFWSASEQERSTILWSNFEDYNLQDANTVMIFGVSPLMKSLSEKISKECKPGTDILSYRFELPLAYGNNQNLLRADIIYDVQEMKIYRCK